ncbi:CsiV family protein [Ketobacter sp.]|uniref:CsiV family protein n=1 Tax=Ketobacter sp. TaxID=2083498 RepID=UPI000F2B416A|nr:CsiV family protein [Ketobacter sp.]RLT93459.1 MAG: hypothetical protein D9N14_18330 [Ketobacter sp.]
MTSLITRSRLWCAALFATPFALSTISLSTTAQAAQEKALPWYQVSLVVFKHRNSPMGNETWPAPETLELSFPPGILELEPASEAAKSNPTEEKVAFRSTQPLDEEFRQALRSIKLSSNYEIMTTASWNQPALDGNQAIPILIQAGNEYAGYYELEGSITLVVSRYLHLKTDLWLSEYIQKVEMVAPWWETSSTVTGGGDLDSPSYQEVDFSSNAYNETITRYESVRTVVLNESRRMRSGELHYLDNPMFGVLVKVVPYSPETMDSALPDSPLKDASPISLR